MNLKISTFLRVIIGALVAVLIVTAFNFFATRNIINIVQKSWSDFQSERSDKALFFYSVSRDLGYGGMIHAFKNYVLRTDDTNFDTALTKVHAVHSNIQSYRLLDISG